MDRIPVAALIVSILSIVSSSKKMFFALSSVLGMGFLIATVSTVVLV